VDTPVYQRIDRFDRSPGGLKAMTVEFGRCCRYQGAMLLEQYLELGDSLNTHNPFAIEPLCGKLCLTGEMNRCGSKNQQRRDRDGGQKVKLRRDAVTERRPKS
jgi:hypothetical protein